MTAPEFVYVSYIRTTPELLYRALTERAFMERYWGIVVESDWKVGSAAHLGEAQACGRATRPRRARGRSAAAAGLHVARDHARME